MIPPRLCATSTIGSYVLVSGAALSKSDAQKYLVVDIPLEPDCKVAAMLRHAVLVV
jgi:hypothetical protein